MTTKTPRRKHDQYFTPEWAVEILARKITENGNIKAIFEPCSGRGVIGKYFGPPSFLDNDIDPKMEASYKLDATLDATWRTVLGVHWGTPPGWWCISNPPGDVKQMPAIVRNALTYFDNVAMYLQLSWLEPCKNRPDIRDPDYVIALPRHSFTGNGTKNMTHAWFIWSPLIKHGFHIHKEPIPR